MKRILLYLSIILSLFVVINSCIYEKISDDGETPVPPKPPEPPIDVTKKTYYLSFVAGQIDDVNTLAVPEIDDTSVPVMWWRASEMIGVFMKGDDGTELFSNKKYELPSLASGNRQVILYDSIETTLQQALCYGYTPYKTSISGSILSHTLNSVQDQSANSSKMDIALNDNVLMIAPASSPFALNQGTGVLQFENVFAFLRFQVTKSNSFNTFNFQKITGVKLYVANENEPEIPLDDYILTGDYTIDISKAPSVAGYEGPKFTSGASNITATVTGGDNISTSNVSSPYVWFVINPLEIKSNERLYSFVETTNGYIIISAHTFSSLKANNVYTFNVEASESNTVSDYIVVYYSDQEASNCYIVPRAGMCQIPLKTVSGTDLRGDTVEWLWASKEGGSVDFDIKELIDPTSLVYDEAGGNVRFRVGTKLGKYTKGNVILALKDHNDNIVWTWHIWITDLPEEVEYDSNPNTYLLDRNVGALSADTLSPAIDTYGFVYQWGRKDPFVGGDGRVFDEWTGILSVARAHTIRNGEVTWGTAASTATVGTVGETVGTVGASVKYPMRFIYNNTSLSEDDPADWLSESNPNLWSDEEKTDYDPCPYGYKVPGINELMTILYTPWKNYHDFVNKVVPSRPSVGFYNMENSNRYWIYHRYFAQISSMWPTAGMRQGRHGLIEHEELTGAQLKYSGTDQNMGRGYYWTSTPLKVGSPGASYRMEMRNSILYSKDTYGPNADAYPVRCVKITP